MVKVKRLEWHFSLARVRLQSGRKEHAFVEDLPPSINFTLKLQFKELNVTQSEEKNKINMYSCVYD